MNKFNEFRTAILHGPATTSTVTVSGGITSLTPSPLPDRKEILLYNPGPAVIYVGGPDVHINDGIPIAAGGSFNLPAGRLELYATVSGTFFQAVRVLEVT